MAKKSPWGKAPDISVRVQAASCPGCGKRLDGAMALDGDGAVPAEGDLTVCFYCAAPLEFSGPEGALELRVLAGDELTLALADPNFRRAIAVVRDAIG